MVSEAIGFLKMIVNKYGDVTVRDGQGWEIDNIEVVQIDAEINGPTVRIAGPSASVNSHDKVLEVF